jgi:hypothetical protein
LKGFASNQIKAKQQAASKEGIRSKEERGDKANLAEVKGNFDRHDFSLPSSSSCLVGTFSFCLPISVTLD